MTKEKYVPSRRCIVCRKVQAQSDLIRIVQTEEGLRLCETPKQNGRSCYICKNPECITIAFEKNAFAKSLRRSVPKDELEHIKNKLINN